MPLHAIGGLTPGGRVRKNEPLGSRLQRVAVSELGLQV
jgi:hypothetical protein